MRPLPPLGRPRNPLTLPFHETPAFAYIFALALLAAGQSASLTVTLSGQIISEGFLQWKTKPWKRRLITRCIGIVPSVAVAAAVGKDGLNALLVGSQVALSIVSHSPHSFPFQPCFQPTEHASVPRSCRSSSARKLPPISFLATPLRPPHPTSLIVLTSSHIIMSLPKSSSMPATPPPSAPRAPRTLTSTLRELNPFRTRVAPAGYGSFASIPSMIWLAWAIWLIIVIANVYAIYDLIIGAPGT